MSGSDDVDIACTLDVAGQTGQLAEWAALLRHRIGRERVDGGWSVTFPADPELAARIADLAVREQRCCAFFTFTVAIEGGRVRLDATAPPAAQPLLDELLN